MTNADEPRKKLLKIIEDEPGLHFRAIQRKTDFSIGQLEYHLYKMEKEEEIITKKDGRYKRYFVMATSDVEKKRLSFHIRNKLNRRIIIIILRKKGVSREFLEKKLNERAKIEKGVAEMKTDNIIVEKDRLLTLRNPGMVKEYLKKSKNTFMEELAESLIDLLDDDES